MRRTGRIEVLCGERALWLDTDCSLKSANKGWLYESGLLTIGCLVLFFSHTAFAQPDSRSQQAIDDLVSRVRPNAWINGAAEIRGLISKGINPTDAIPSLTSLIGDPSIFTARTAGEILWEIGRPGIEALISSAEDRNFAGRGSALRVLDAKQRSRSSQSPGLSKRLVDIFTAATSEGDATLQAIGVEGLSYRGPWLDERAQTLVEAMERPDFLAVGEAQKALLEFIDDYSSSRSKRRLSVAVQERVVSSLLKMTRADLASGDRKRISRSLDNCRRLKEKGAALVQDLKSARELKNMEEYRETIDWTLRAIAPDEPSAVATPDPAKSDSLTSAPLSVLIEKLASGNYESVYQAASAIKKLGPRATEAVPALIAFIHDDPRTPFESQQHYYRQYAKHFAVEALGAIGSPAAEAAVPELTKKIYSSDSELRRCAVIALGKIRMPLEVVLPALLIKLKDGNDEVRKAAAASLEKLGPAARQAMPQLLEIYLEDDPQIRHELAQALARIEPRTGIPLLLDELGKSNVQYKQSNYAHILAELGEFSAIPDLTRIVAQGGDGDDESFALLGKALLQLVGLNEMVTWIADGNDLQREAAIEILTTHGSEWDLPILEPLINSPDRKVAATASHVAQAIRRRFHSVWNEKSTEQLIDDLRSDDIPGNAQKAWEVLTWREHDDLSARLGTVIASTTDTQQRKIAAVLLTHDAMTTCTLDLLKLVIENLRTGSLAFATSAAVDWLIVNPFASELENRKVEILQAAEIGADAQMARLAALVLQFDPRYKPTEVELILLAENLADDGIPGNAPLALEILSRSDNEKKQGLLEAKLKSTDPQAAGRAALALLEQPGAVVTPQIMKALFGVLREDQYVSYGLISDAMDLLSAANLPEKREFLEKELVSLEGDAKYHRRMAGLLLAIPDYKPSSRMIDFQIDQLRSDHAKGNAWRAVEVLSKFRNDEITSKLLKALDSDDRQQRLWAAEALPALHEFSGGAPQRLTEVTLENLDDEFNVESGAWADDLKSFYNAKETALYLIEHPSLATTELEVSLDSADSQRRWLAAIILAKTGRGRRIERIAALILPELGVGGDNWMAGAALKGLGPAIIPYLEARRDDPDPRLREHAALIIEDIRRPPQTLRELYRREEKFQLRDADYLMDLPEYWSYRDRPW